MRWAMVAVMVTGCIRPGAFTCELDPDCGPQGLCEPTGFCSFPDPVCGRRYGAASGTLSDQCVTGSGDDGGLPDGTPSDLDGDGILNEDDNCPEVGNANQANEDGDATGDACDPCPPFAGGGDQDGDGVGDACDPHPTVIGDQIMLFEGFADGIPAGWTASGEWAVTAGVLTSTASDPISTMVVPYTATPHQTLYASATISAINGTSGGSIGIVDRFDAGGDVGVHCGGGRSTSGLFGLIDAESQSIIETVPYPFAVGTAYQLQMTRTDEAYDCIDNNGPTTVSDTPNITGGPFIGFRSRLAASAFPWILVVRSP